MKKIICLTLFVALSLLTSCKNKKTDKEVTKNTSPELVGTFSFEENGTPAFQIIDSIINEKKVKFLQLAHTKNPLINSRDYFNSSKNNNNIPTSLKPFKKEKDWIYEYVLFMEQNYTSNYDKYSFFSINRDIKYSEKISEKTLKQTEALAKRNNLNIEDFYKKFEKGFFISFIKNYRINVKQIYKTSKKIIIPKTEIEGAIQARKERINQLK